jgi:hypothetical protein
LLPEAPWFRNQKSEKTFAGRQLPYRFGFIFGKYRHLPGLGFEMAVKRIKILPQVEFDLGPIIKPGPPYRLLVKIKPDGLIK